jgi:dihydrodiol dehydrogenase / D-xylose 1-dehydrogenase (NADP)
MNEITRWGIMSTGNMAQNFARALIPLETAELVAVGSRSREHAESFGHHFDVPHRHDSYEALAADPDVDAIYIATPHGRHNEDMLLCIEHGKHILCEKAFTINTKQAEDVFRRADEKGLLVVEAMWTRFLPAFRKLLAMIADGELGNVRTIMANFGFRADYDPHGRLFNPELGGGALLDITIYPVMLALSVFGEPSEIRTSAYIGETGVDEQDSIIFWYDDGRQATLTASLQVNLPCTAEIAGTRARVSMPDHWWNTREYRIVRSGAEPELINMPYEHSGYSYEAEEFMRCLRNGKNQTEMMPRADTLLLMRTMDALRQQWGLVYPMESS